MTTKKAWQQNLDHAQKPLFKPNRSTLIGKTESCQNEQHSKFASLGPLYGCLTLWFKINTFSQSNQFPSYIQEIPGPTIYHIVEQTVRSSFPFSKDLLVFLIHLTTRSICFKWQLKVLCSHALNDNWKQNHLFFILFP